MGHGVYANCMNKVDADMVRAVKVILIVGFKRRSRDRNNYRRTSVTIRYTFRDDAAT